MYNDWLYFFNSPQTEIDVKNKKEKQQVIKEWTDDGGIKISGTKPSKWSIVLQPALSTDIYTLQYKLKNDKLEAVELFKRAFKYQDNNLFVESEKQYNELKKVQLDIKDLVSNNNNNHDVMEVCIELSKTSPFSKPETATKQHSAALTPTTAIITSTPVIITSFTVA